MSEYPQWVQEDVPREALNALLDLVDRQPFPERTRPPMVRLNDKVPSFRRLVDLEDREYAWGLIEALEKDLAWITIGRPRKRHGDIAEYEYAIRLYLNAEAEETVRRAMDHPPPTDSYGQLWQEAVLKAARTFPTGDPTLLSRSPIRVPERAYAEVAERLGQLANLPDRSRTRHVSARLFWGLSKLLDTRIEAVNAFAGRQVLVGKPVLLNAHAPSGHPTGLLFIENEETYQSLKAGLLPEETRGLILLYSAGFRASASRLRERDGVSLHLSRESDYSAVDVMLEALRGSSHFPTWFFGDLDYSGMQILKQLRAVLPQTQAWRPGYEQLRLSLEAGIGHGPDEADKQGQRDPVRTGCAYSDEVLLPLLRRTNMFLDQEVI